MSKSGTEYLIAADKIESPRRAVDGAVDCPCCGPPSLAEPGSWEIRPVCGWEDDPVQERYPDLAGGANRLSLEQARTNFKLTGHSDPDRGSR